jgi:hypothetical protein
MHVVIGLTGMQQGLAFYQLRKLLMVLIISNKNKSNRKLIYLSRRSRGHKQR